MLAVALTLVISIGDYFTGPYLVIASFYLAPVALAAWFVGWRAALMIAALATVLGVIGTALDPREATVAGLPWNGVFRFVTYSLLSVVLSAERNAMRTIHEFASIDPLTGLLNRRRFYEQAKLELARTKRGATTVAVVYVDIDDLKHQNDTFGHDAGDMMLVRFAKTAKEIFRTTDLLSRVGGDEFCFMLPGADLVAAEATVERLRRHLIENADMQPICFSAGIIAGPVIDDLDVESTVRSADLLMLDAKMSGKTRTESRSGL
ncbi:MAG: GGDEF domain-containing protein [Acidimicrobiales bacterium]